MRLPPLSLVIGGASSGKSGFAEDLVLATGLVKVYVATAEAHDDEMEAKIAAHRQTRAGDGWRSVEAPRNAAATLAKLAPDEIALLDCATFWLSNAMLADADWEDEADDLIRVMVQTEAPVVVVTNEIGHGVVPETSLGRTFRSAQGILNQRIAAEAGLVVLVTAGLPQILKGTLDLGGAAEW